MEKSFFQKITLEKTLIYIIIFAVVITFAFIFYLFFGQFTKGIEIINPRGGNELEIGKTHQITWKASGIDRVGIVLYKGGEPKWIAKNVPAGAEKYDWKIHPGQEYGDDYWIAVFEYPWHKGNELDYTRGAFVITYPELATCEDLSIENEWPYVPSDLPHLRRVFITEEKFTGDLGGLEGADQRCQSEAEKMGYQGNWKALIGGESEEEIAVSRLRESMQEPGGAYVLALPEATLIRGATCHRLLGNNLNSFLFKLSGSLAINKEKLGEDFYEGLSGVWLGRIDSKSKKNCIPITSVLDSINVKLQEKYSFTSTCQNWTNGEMFAEGYPVSEGEVGGDFPTCFTPAGESTKTAALGAFATGVSGDDNLVTNWGKYCSEKQGLICVEAY